MRLLQEHVRWRRARRAVRSWRAPRFTRSNGFPQNPRAAPPATAGGNLRSLPREADLRVADPVDGARPDGIRAAGAVDRHRLEIEQLAIAAAPGSRGADRSALHRDGVDDGEWCERDAAVGAL